MIRFLLICACAFAPALTLASAPAQVAFADTAHIIGTEVLLGDVANLTVVPDAWRDRARHIVVATLPVRGDTQALPVSRLARAARLQMPGIKRWLQSAALDAGTVAITRENFTSERDETASCVKVRQPVDAGVAIRPDDIEAFTSPCQESTVRRVAYSRDTHVVRATQALAAGDYVTALPLAALARVRHGDVTTERVSFGNVTVTRDQIAPRDEAIGRAPVAVSSHAEQS
jgi:hypothetical protein